MCIFQFAAINTCRILRGFGTGACGGTAARGRRGQEDCLVRDRRERRVAVVKGVTEGVDRLVGAARRAGAIFAEAIDRHLRSAVSTVDEAFLDPTGRKE
jgi:hypothetical protein